MSLPTAKDVIRDVADRYGVRVDDLTGLSRAHPISRIRQEAMWEVRQRTTMSFPAIGRRFGGRDHTTILHGVRQHEKRRSEGRPIA